jgi:hypothetical protein
MDPTFGLLPLRMGWDLLVLVEVGLATNPILLASQTSKDEFEVKECISSVIFLIISNCFMPMLSQSTTSVV